jgi:hypothetical protein
MREYIRRVTDDERIANSGVTNSAYGRPMSSTITPPKSEMVRLANRPPWYTSLFFQLLVAIVAGILIIGLLRNRVRPGGQRLWVDTESRTRLDDVADDQPEYQRESGDRLEVDERLDRDDCGADGYS